MIRKIANHIIPYIENRGREEDIEQVFNISKTSPSNVLPPIKLLFINTP